MWWVLLIESNLFPITFAHQVWFYYLTNICKYMPLHCDTKPRTLASLCVWFYYYSTVHTALLPHYITSVRQSSSVHLIVRSVSAPIVCRAVWSHLVLLAHPFFFFSFALLVVLILRRQWLASCLPVPVSVAVCCASLAPLPNPLLLLLLVVVQLLSSALHPFDLHRFCFFLPCLLFNFFFFLFPFSQSQFQFSVIYGKAGHIDIDTDTHGAVAGLSVCRY